MEQVTEVDSGAHVGIPELDTAQKKADSNGAIGGVWAAVVASVTCYVFLVFIIALPRLYVAYTRINNVRDELSGTSSKNSEGR